jgi:hypothetical protein
MKLVYDKVNARVLVNDVINAFYTDNLYCDDEVINNVIDMFNNYKTLKDIDNYLLDESKSTSEDREIIIEGLFLVFKHINSKIEILTQVLNYSVDEILEILGYYDGINFSAFDKETHLLLDAIGESNELFKTIVYREAIINGNFEEAITNKRRYPI